MCTSFVYRGENVVIGMNFDNDGKDFRIAPCRGGDFLVSVKTHGSYYPSFGLNCKGVFVNDLMVDSNGAGKYKRQNEKRWLTTSIVQHVVNAPAEIDEVRGLLAKIEVVNSPYFSTHNFISDPNGNSLVIEPGRNNLYSTRDDSPFCIMANFPLSDYEDVIPQKPTGSGADRYLWLADALSRQTGRLTVDRAFEMLNGVRQDGPEWVTELSLVYDPETHELAYCLDRAFDSINRYDFESQEAIVIRH